jgi:TonB-linked SusC/RagA family outer membrane protein
MRKTLLLLVLIFSISVQAVLAQTQKIKGQVLGSDGGPAAGVSVKVKGTESGTITDVDGNYEIDLPEGKSVLVFSSLMDGTKEVAVKDASAPVVVNMDDKGGVLVDETTIYGKTESKRERVASISTVTEAQIASRPVTNIVSALDGSVPGLQVSSGGGQPGSTPDILLRGQNSLSASSNPLIVLDGAVFDGSMSAINPYDVAKMEVLKDAAATSIYGARGANGVLMITTKKGRSGDNKPSISVDAQVGMFSRFIPEYDRIQDPQAYYKLAWQGIYNYIYGTSKGNAAQAGQVASANLIPILGGYNSYNVPDGQLIDAKGVFNPNATLKYNPDDWNKAIQRTGLRQKYNVSVSNNDEKSDYFLSVGYNKDKGIFQKSDYDRITARLSVNSKITPWLKSGFSLGVTYDNQRSFAFGGSAYANPFLTTRLMAPIYPIYLHDATTGAIVNGEDGQPLYDFGDNPQYGQNRPFAANQNIVATVNSDNNTNKAYSGFGTGYLEASFLKDFKLRSNISVNTYNAENSLYQNKYFGDGEPFNGILTNSLTNQISYTFNQLLTWKPSFGIFGGESEHSLDITVGHENYLLNNKSNYIQRAGFGSAALESGAAAAYGIGSGSSTDNHAIESYLSQLSYSYKQKYTFSASFRRDGSSRFSPESRWGNFWSVGGGWFMKDESFLKDVSWITELKVRSSYGVSGNENLGGGSAYYGYTNYYTFTPNNTNPGYTFLKYGNPDLKWESAFGFNVGTDFSLFNNRLSGTIDYYIRGSDNLLFVQPLAPSTGVSGIRANVGSLKNSGIELTLHGTPVQMKNFSWTVDVIASHNKNQVTKVQSTSGADTLFLGYSIFTKGLSINNFFMPHFVGVDPETGLSQYTERYDENGNEVNTVTTDYNLASLPSNSTVVAKSDRVVEGSLTNNFRYKNFEFSFKLNFGIGGKFYDGVYAGLMEGGYQNYGQNYSTDMSDAWTPENKGSQIPLNYGEITSRVSDRFLISNSYLNIKNINLAYNIPLKMLKTVGFKNLKIYAQVENIFVLTARKGVDLQQNFSGSSDYVYPPYRTVMFGLQLGL